MIHKEMERGSHQAGVVEASHYDEQIWDGEVGKLKQKTKQYLSYGERRNWRHNSSDRCEVDSGTCP